MREKQKRRELATVVFFFFNNFSLYTALLIVGKTYDYYGLKDEFKEMLVSEENLSEEQVSKVLDTLDIVPTLKSITIENGTNRIYKGI